MARNKSTVLSFCVKSFCLLLAFSACASNNAQSKGGSNAAPASGASRASGAPDWTRDPYNKFDKQVYVAAVGIGNSRQAAEKDALGKLVAIFGQNIQVDEKISTAYSETVKSGAVASWSENTSVNSTIGTSAGMDSLVGAEIGETWQDNKNNFYAAAILNKSKAIQIYSGMVKENQAMIDNLLKMTEAEKNTLDGFARYKFAAIIADINTSYGNLLSYIGAPSYAQGLKKGDSYRLEAQNISKAIPIGITVDNDKAGRIEGAFAKAFSDIGFRSGGKNSRYMLKVKIVTSPEDYPNQQNKFTRIEVTANLTDTSLNSVLLPYNFNKREGHTTQPLAENRAYATAERIINEEYAELLNTQLLPKKR